MTRFRLWMAGVCLGLIFGALEGAIRFGGMLAGFPVSTGPEVLWICPAFFGAFAAGYGAFVVLAERVLKGAEPIAKRVERFLPSVVPALLIGGISFFGYRGLFRLHFQTAWYAEWLILLGLTYQTVRVFLKYGERVVPALARAAPWGVAAVALLFVGIPLTKRVEEARRLDALPPPTPNAPNVLLIVLDTLRADRLGAYGYERPTPTLDRFAGEGLRFEQAIVSAPWTFPSHATMMTGRYSYEHLAEMNTGKRLDDRFFTLAEAFSQNGYATGAFVANRENCAANLGFDQGFLHYEDNFWGLADIVQHTSLNKPFLLSEVARRLTGVERRGIKPAPEINRELLAWLPRRGDRPFFAWLNFMDTHDPYYAPPPYDRLYGTEPANGVIFYSDVENVRGHQVGDNIAPSTRRKIDAYDCAIAYLDASLAALFDELRRQEIYDDTIILIVSDHGEAFGEHKYFGHGQTLYWEVLHVPMLLRYPKTVPAGGAVEMPVSLADVPATLADLAGLRLDTPFPGRCLVGPLDEMPILSERLRNPYYSQKLSVARGDLISILSATSHAVYSVDGASLFDRADRLEQNNLAGTEAGQAELRRLAQEAAKRWPGREIPEAWLAPKPSSAPKRSP